ncbi:hypothetical protein [Methylobacterium platani]|uniref:Uncharacterized protein n=2 Tax=Methylobacterium platani TaxID=427683 RepID=A0A179SEN1_9HYPH|nr:hypothetical protein [Methylobacterium platani]KMO21395.1 hypothetical protein SQ03_03320 [Methylobacterium platani JCM 14648]OAS26327.1 hypothetical protein A5481_06325 [Methylobacterium platani]
MGEASLKAQWMRAQVALVRAGGLAPIFEDISDHALGILLLTMREFAEILPSEVTLQERYELVLWLYGWGYLRILARPDGSFQLIKALPQDVGQQRPIMTSEGIQRPSQQALEADPETI